MVASTAQYLRVAVHLPIDLVILSLKLALYMFQSCRPDRRWTYSQAVRIYIMKIGAKHTALLDTRTNLSLEQGKEQGRFRVAEPASDERYDGAMNEKLIRPGPVGVTWQPAAPSPSTLKTSSAVALHFHGGAYATSTGRDADSGFAAKMLRRHLGCSFVCSPCYRLATNENGHFPAAIQDAITAYLYLVDEMDISPSQIILSGDSAGGNLVLALLRYISEYGDTHGIGLPAAATLWSPWVDIRDALDSSVESKPNFSTDYITTPFARWGATKYTLNGSIDPGQPYISPLRHPFSLKSGTVPLFIQTGDGEVLHRDICLMSERLERAGWPVKLFESPGCPHDIMMMGGVLDFAAEAATAAEEAKDYFVSVTDLQLTT